MLFISATEMNLQKMLRITLQCIKIRHDLISKWQIETIKIQIKTNTKQHTSSTQNASSSQNWNWQIDFFSPAHFIQMDFFCTYLNNLPVYKFPKFKLPTFIPITLRVSSLIQSLSFPCDDPDKSSFEPNKAQNQRWLTDG